MNRSLISDFRRYNTYTPQTLRETDSTLHLVIGRESIVSSSYQTVTNCTNKDTCSGGHVTHVQYNDIRYTGGCDGAADGSLLCHCEGGQVVLAVRHVREGHHRPGGACHWRRIWYWSSHVSQVSYRVYYSLWSLY